MVDDAAVPRRAPSRPGHDLVRSLRSTGAFRQPREMTPEPAGHGEVSGFLELIGEDVEAKRR